VQKFWSLCFSQDAAMIAAIGSTGTDQRCFIWTIGRKVGLGGMFPLPASTRGIAFDPQDPFRLLVFGATSLATVLINTIDKVRRAIAVPGITAFERFTFVAAVSGLLLVTSGPYLITIVNDDVVEVADPVGAKIDMIRSVRDLLFLVAGPIVWLFKVDGTAPYLAKVGPLDIHARAIADFAPSPDGDLAVVLYDDSFAGLLDVGVGLRMVKRQRLSQESESARLSPEKEEEISAFLASQAPADLPGGSGLADDAELQQFMGVFVPLPIRYHIGAIVAIATCPRKPLLATCGGQDRTLLVWNLAKRSVVASERLTEPVNSCSFHPSGDLLAVGTSDKLVLYSLTFDQLVLRQKWESLSCTCVSFSNGGHLLAAWSLVIKVIATYGAKTVGSLRGHSLSVKSIAWAANDAFFISSGLDGNVFKWSARHWDRTC
jgi:WD40 repeat protein